MLSQLSYTPIYEPLAFSFQLLKLLAQPSIQLIANGYWLIAFYGNFKIKQCQVTTLADQSYKSSDLCTP